MVHTQFYNGHLMARSEPEQSERHTNIVIQIALGCQHRLRFPRPENGSNHLRNRRLAVATSYRDHGEGKPVTPGGSQRSQRAF